MHTELKENDHIRKIRMEADRKYFFSLLRAICIFGLPACAAFCYLFYRLEPDDQIQFLSPLVVVPIFVFFFVGLPYFTARLHNRWIIRDHAILIKGTSPGTIKKSKIFEWSYNWCEDLSGYYLLSISTKNRLNGPSLILSEKDVPLSLLDQIFSDIKYNPNKAWDALHE